MPGVGPIGPGAGEFGVAGAGGGATGGVGLLGPVAVRWRTGVPWDGPTEGVAWVPVPVPVPGEGLSVLAVGVGAVPPVSDCARWTVTAALPVGVPLELTAVPTGLEAEPGAAVGAPLGPEVALWTPVTASPVLEGAPLGRVGVAEGLAGAPADAADVRLGPFVVRWTSTAPPEGPVAVRLGLGLPTVVPVPVPVPEPELRPVPVWVVVPEVRSEPTALVLPGVVAGLFRVPLGLIAARWM